jgi:hypothetical protein
MFMKKLLSFLMMLLVFAVSGMAFENDVGNDVNFNVEYNVAVDVVDYEDFSLFEYDAVFYDYQNSANYDLVIVNDEIFSYECNYFDIPEVIFIGYDFSNSYNYCNLYPVTVKHKHNFDPILDFRLCYYKLI